MQKCQQLLLGVFVSSYKCSKTRSVGPEPAGEIATLPRPQSANGMAGTPHTIPLDTFGISVSRIRRFLQGVYTERLDRRRDDRL